MNIDYNFSAFVTASFSLVVAGISLGWNIFRDCIERPKLKINMYIAEIYDPIMGQMPHVISVSVTNAGKKAIVIKGHGFHMKNKTNILFPEVMSLFNEKRLEPYDSLSVIFSHEILLNLIGKIDQVRSFFIYDTTGKEWKLKRKIFRKFKGSLKEKKQVSGQHS